MRRHVSSMARAVNQFFMMRNNDRPKFEAPKWTSSHANRPTIHYFVRIKCLSQILMQRCEAGGQGMERCTVLFGMTEQGGMAAGLFRFLLNG